jgi:hypothetical protein
MYGHPLDKVDAPIIGNLAIKLRVNFFFSLNTLKIEFFREWKTYNRTF